MDYGSPDKYHLSVCTRKEIVMSNFSGFPVFYRCIAAVLWVLALTVPGCGERRGAEAMDGTPKALAQRPPLEFQFDTFDKITIRKVPTTQIAITVKQWPGNTFLLWMPEEVTPFWEQWDPELGLQRFERTRRGGLYWDLKQNPKCRITAELIPLHNSLLLEVRVTNRTAKKLEGVATQNCFHLSAAPDFCKDDLKQLHIRKDGQWRSLAELKPKQFYFGYPRKGFLESGRTDPWLTSWKEYVQEARVDCPLMIGTSQDGRRCVATASNDYVCVFHNRMEYLRCMHSQQGATVIEAGQTAVFRQWIYFFDGPLNEFIPAIENDICREDF
jgi:hypothetical protein